MPQESGRWFGTLMSLLRANRPQFYRGAYHVVSDSMTRRPCDDTSLELLSASASLCLVARRFPRCHADGTDVAYGVAHDQSRRLAIRRRSRQSVEGFSFSGGTRPG